MTIIDEDSITEDIKEDETMIITTITIITSERVVSTTTITTKTNSRLK